MFGFLYASKYIVFRMYIFLYTFLYNIFLTVYIHFIAIPNNHFTQATAAAPDDDQVRQQFFQTRTTSSNEHACSQYNTQINDLSIHHHLYLLLDSI